MISWLLLPLCTGPHQIIRGYPFMTSTKITFWPPTLSTCVHMSRTHLWTSTCSRHEWNIHPSLETASTMIFRTEIRLYDCNLFKTVLLVIYITNLYGRKISIFYSAQRRNSGKKDRMTSVDSKFKWTSTWALTPPLVRMRPPEPDPSLSV